MKTVSGMGRFPTTIELKNDAEQCGAANPYPPPLIRTLLSFDPESSVIMNTHHQIVVGVVVFCQINFFLDNVSLITIRKPQLCSRVLRKAMSGQSSMMKPRRHSLVAK